MYLTQNEEKIVRQLNFLGIREKLPYIENGIECYATSMQELYFKAVHSYQTFSLVNKKYKPYSENDFRNIALLIEYQKKIGAYYNIFQSKRSGLTDEVIEKYSRVKLKELLYKAYRVNRGIYFISSLQGYSSTTLYENPVLVRSEDTKRSHKERVWGSIQKVLPKTLMLFDGTTSRFDYHYTTNGSEGQSDSIYEIYDLAYKCSSNFEIVDDGLYSGQQKRIIQKLKDFGG